MTDAESESQSMLPHLAGILPPLVTPFDDEGEIDRSALAELIDLQLHAGVHGIVALGAAGQGPAMRADQRRTAAEMVADRIGGRVPLILHVGTADLQTTIQLARHAEGLRPDALALSPPYYYSDHTPFEVAAHFAGVAEAVSLPLYIYEAPRFSGLTVTPISAARIAKAIPAVVGLIAEDGSLDRVLQYLRAIPDSCTLLSGAIECLLPATPYGLAGVTSEPVSPFPELCVALWNSVVSQRYEEAFERQAQLNEIAAVMERYAATHGRGIYREVFRMRGINISRYPRWPTQELEEPLLERLREDLDSLGAFSLPAPTPEPKPLDIEETAESDGAELAVAVAEQEGDPATPLS